MTEQDIAAALKTIQDNPLAAADIIEKAAYKMLELAAHLRKGNGTRDNGAANDRVQMRVVGPNGEIKQQTDTGPIP